MLSFPSSYANIYRYMQTNGYCRHGMEWDSPRVGHCDATSI